LAAIADEQMKLGKWNFVKRRLMNTTVNSAWNYYMSQTAHKDTAISFEVISEEFKALPIYSTRNFVQKHKIHYNSFNP
jgi:hypothetical protein